jgi:hypothetical protein
MKSSRASVLGLVAVLMLPSLTLAVDPPPGGGYPGGNTALGDDALFSQPAGFDANSTAIGFQALYHNVVGGDGNTAIGYQALYGNTEGFANTATGWWALNFNSTGARNTAVGSAALAANRVGGSNTAIGDVALTGNMTGNGNTASGASALTFNSSGSYNTAIGSGALAFNTTGSENTAIGDAALNKNTTGSGNIALGKVAGAKLTTGNNNIDIGNQGTRGESNTIRIGASQKKTLIAGISGTTMPDGVAVLIDSKGQLGVATSSARYKEKIEPMDKASDALLSLKPVTFRYKKELDSTATLQFGLVAEEVAKVDPDLVVRDDSGKPYTVRYEAVNAMLLNEFLKEHRKVEALEAQAKESHAELAELRAVLKAQAAQIQKVSAQVQIAQPAPQVVANE